MTAPAPTSEGYETNTGLHFAVGPITACGIDLRDIRAYSVADWSSVGCVRCRAEGNLNSEPNLSDPIAPELTARAKAAYAEHDAATPGFYYVDYRFGYEDGFIAGALSERAGQAEHVPSEIVKTAAIAFLNNHASMSRMEVREAAWWFIDYASRMALEEANRR